MGMDPVAMSQGIYGGFGGQGMGMNGMNMGMGFNAGQGAFGGFNGQSPAAWNAGQDKFNQNAYGGHAGMGGGDFGANTGYGGYNMPPHQGNFNQMHHHQYPNNDFHHGHHGQGFQSRGRGRGRGYPNAGRGRGGYHQISQGNQANYEPLHQQTPPQVTRRGSPQYGPIEDRPAHQQKDRATTDNQQELKSAETADVLTAEEQLSKELDPGDAEDNDEKKPPAVPSNEAQVVDSTDRVVTETEASEKPQTDPAPKMEEEKPAPIQTYISDEPPQSKLPVAEGTTTVAPVMMPPPSPMIPTGPAALHAPDQPLESSSRGRGAGRGFHRGVPDYRVGSHGRGSGYLSNGNQPHIQPTPLVVKPIVPPASPKGLGVEGAPKAPKALREGLPNTGVRGFSIVGRASAVAQSRPNGRTTTRRCVVVISFSTYPHMLIDSLAPPVSVPALLPDIDLPIVVIIVTAPPVSQAMMSGRGDESVTVVILGSMRRKTAKRTNPRARVLETHRPIHLPSGRHIGVVATTAKKRRAAIGHIDPTGIGVEREMQTIEAAESDRSPPILPLMVLADAQLPVQLRMVTERSMMNPPRPRASAVQTMKVIIVTISGRGGVKKK